MRWPWVRRQPVERELSRLRAMVNALWGAAKPAGALGPPAFPENAYELATEAIEGRIGERVRAAERVAEARREQATTDALAALAANAANWERECERRENTVRAELNAVIGDRQAAELHGRVAVAQAHEEWAGRLREAVIQHAADMAGERQRYADLVAQLLELRREGFQPPSAAPPVIPLQPLDHAIVDAIAQVCEPGTELEGRLARYAQEQLGRGIAPAKIARAIVRGGDADDDEDLEAAVA